MSSPDSSLMSVPVAIRSLKLLIWVGLTDQYFRILKKYDHDLLSYCGDVCDVPVAPRY